MHANRLTDIKNTQDIQIENAEKVKNELLGRYFNDNEIIEFKELLGGFPFNQYDENNVIKAVNILSEKSNTDSFVVEKIIEDIKNKKFIF